MPIRRARVAIALALTLGGAMLVTGPAPAAGSAVVIVVANPSAPTVNEGALRSRLLDSGATVQLVDDNAVTTATATAATFVVVSRSATATRVGTALAPVRRPVWVASPWLFGRLDLTGRASGADFGTVTTTATSVTAPAHPVASGRSGSVTFAASGQTVGWGAPPASASTISTVGVAGTQRPAAFSIAAGAALATGSPAPGCRLAFPLPSSASAVNAEYWALFDGAAHFAGTGCDPASALPAPAPDPQRLVLLVSIDGLNPDAIRSLGAAGTPALHRIMTEGTSTLNARTTVEKTITLPNHTSMLTSRAVTTGGGHRVTFNEDNGSTVHVTAGGYVSSIFDAAHDSGLATAMYAGKPKFNYLDRSYDGSNGAPDTTGPDDGRDKVDVYSRLDSEANTTAVVAALDAGLTGFAFVHLPEPDVAGHAAGFMTTPYLDAVTRADGYVGRILDAVASDPALAARTTIVVTSDHGGLGAGHSDPTRPANYTVPFMAWGAGVAAGADLYALNPDRVDPGTTRPLYTAARQPVRNAEAGNLAAELLGLRAVPRSWPNSDQSLDLQ